MKRSLLTLAGAAFLISGITLSLVGYGQNEVVQARIGSIHVLSIDASINPITKDYLINGIRDAQAEGASLVLIELDTPGGLVSSTKEIVETILNSPIPIVVWVGPAGAWAASAGTFITMSANVASMAPGAAIGAAHPVNIDGSNPGGQSPTTPSDSGNDESTEDESDSESEETNSQSSGGDPIEQKITNFTAQWAREIAEKRGRNADWAEKAVRESFTEGAQAALDNNVIDLIAFSRADLIVKLNNMEIEIPNEFGEAQRVTLVTEGVVIEERPMSFQENLLNYLADPNLVYILLSLGLLALTYEFLSPTIGIGFIVGGIFLLLAFMGLQVLPVSLVGISLIVFGVLLMVLDLFTATNGILTVGGIVALLVGSFTLFELPEVRAQFSPWTVFVTVGSMTAFIVFVVAKGLVIQRRVPVTGMEGMVGLSGRVEDSLAPIGRVFVNGEYWNAKSLDDSVSIEEQAEIVVERIENGKLIVRRKD